MAKTNKAKSEKKTTKVNKLVPDTSVIIEGIVSEQIEKKLLNPSIIIIHEAVLSELENQANRGREIGISGLEEIQKLNNMSKKNNFKIEFKGHRPGEFEIKYAKSGEIDSLIRDLAYEEKATLLTADRVQAFVAESKNIKVIMYEFEEKKKDTLQIEKFFDDETMSVHLKEGCQARAKKGRPGAWKYIEVRKAPVDKDEIRDIGKEIIEEAHARSDSFVEIDRKGSTIVQLANFRIVITRPPFADGYEITAVRPVAKLTIEDYKLTDKLKNRIGQQAEGILVSGAPGHGKSTFVQALAEFYLKQDKVVKTVEAPRDLVLPNDITQYAISHGSGKEVHDILLLSRPDYTIFDEMRNTSDFKLFSDLRLSGVGMIGVVHATQSIDAVQRFLGRIELGVIPHVVDTVIFIRDGQVDRVYALTMEVKVPSGMTEADLARPVVVIHDFETGKLEFELYSYGEETVVIPVKGKDVSPAMKLAQDRIRDHFSSFTDVIDVEMQSANKAVVYVKPGEKKHIIGRGGENIEKVESRLGIGIDVRESTERKRNSSNGVDYKSSIGKKNVILQLETSMVNKDLDILIDGEFVMTARVSKKAQIKITRNSKLGKFIVESLNTGKNVELVG